MMCFLVMSDPEWAGVRDSDLDKFSREIMELLAEVHA